MEKIMANKKNAHELLGQLFGDLREVWVEIPGDCHLNCPYCFAFEKANDFSFEKVGQEIIRLDNKCDILSLEQILEAIQQFDENFPLTENEKLAGVKKRIAIPGAGEPFVNERTRYYLYGIIEECYKRDIVLTVFTTGDKITQQDMDRLEKYGNCVKLYIKRNSRHPEIQDKLVGRKGYTVERERVLAELITRGFNNGRLGVVTPIMHENYQEAEELMSWARSNNVEFDADTVIDRGRGRLCGCKFKRGENDELIATLKKLQILDRDKFGNNWELTSSYVASNPCTRFDHHLYIKRDGSVAPCVGSPQICYGNIRTQSLKEIWNGKVAQIIRKHEISGVCAGCQNYKDNKCKSCLARSTDDSFNQEAILATGKIPTVGCGTIGPK